MIERAVLGGGIAALIHAWFNRIPVYYSHLTPPPLFTDLIYAPSSLNFIKALGIKHRVYEIPHKILWNNEYLAWPGTVETRTAHMKKTRFTEIAVQTSDDIKKSEQGLLGVMPLSQLYVELYSRLKLYNLIHQVDDLR